jgi:hypothetical protein
MSTHFRIQGQLNKIFGRAKKRMSHAHRQNLPIVLSVISAIVQRYLPQITNLAQSTQSHIQRTAVEIISFTIKQGLTHPLECVPVLVALESSNDMAIASQVFSLHTLLHVQRGNLVHCRFLETMDKVFHCHTKASTTSQFIRGMLYLLKITFRIFS